MIELVKNELAGSVFATERADVRSIEGQILQQQLGSLLFADGEVDACAGLKDRD